MAAVSASMVKELREKTGAGMLDCKNALSESDGDVDKAIDVLRKKGIASAAKKSGRLASEGLIYIHQEGNVASIVEVNCETDFVGKNEDFQGFVKRVAIHVHQQKPVDVAGLLKQEFTPGKTVETSTQEMVVKIGENISIRRFAIVESGESEVVGQYTHMGSRIGSLVKVEGKVTENAVKGVAMHVAAVAPRFLNAESIPQEVLAKEKEIYLEQMKVSGKPAEILEKIVGGKVKKFATENCIEDQIYIKDPDGKKSVSKFLQSEDAQAKIVEFIRFQVGEGMERKSEDFAAEVAKQIGK